MNSKLSKIKARLDGIAIDQLRDEVVRLHEKLEKVENDLYWAHQSLDMYENDMHLMQEQGVELGLTSVDI